MSEGVRVSVAVLGAGSWGTALAWLLGEKGLEVALWCRDAGRAAAMQAQRVNARYLPGTPLPDRVRVTAELPEALAGAQIAVVAVPAQAVRGVLRDARPGLGSDMPLVIAAKGLEQETGLRMSQVAAEALGISDFGFRISDLGAGGDQGAGSTAETSPPHIRNPKSEIRNRVVVLSGPNLSGELVRKVPSTTVVASEDEELAERVQRLFATPFFRVYTNADVTGVELGGALKNIVALGAGISDGLGFGDNTKAALMTRGLAEMVRLGVRCGARPATFMGLSGLGDLVATCGSRLSRNHALGERLGRGERLESALAALGQVAESVPTTAAAREIARRHRVEMPITEEIYRVLYEGQSPREAVAALMSRAFRDEEG